MLGLFIDRIVSLWYSLTEAVSLNIIVFEDKAFKEEIKVTWCHNNGDLIK
jgi:hypothetical protein